MDYHELAAFDKKRRKKVLQHALQSATVFREEVERHHLLSGSTAHNLVVRDMLHGSKPSINNPTPHAQPALCNATQQLLARAQAAHTEEHLARMAAIRKQGMQLAREAAATRLEATSTLRQRAPSRLAAMRRDEEHLAAQLPLRQSLAVQLTRGEAALGASDGRVSRFQSTAAPSAVSTRPASSAPPDASTATSSEHTRQSSTAGTRSSDGSDSDGDSSAASSERSSGSSASSRTAPASERASGRPSVTRSGAQRRLSTLQSRHVPTVQYKNRPDFVLPHGLKKRLGDGQDPTSIVASLESTLSSDQEALELMKLRLGLMKRQLSKVHARTSTPAPQRAAYPPALHQTVDLAHAILRDIIDTVIERSHYRPHADEVAKQKYRWKQQQPRVLDAVARLVLESVVARAVDLLVEDCWDDLAVELDVPSNFAFDMIVKAVAAASRTEMQHVDVMGLLAAGEAVRTATMLELTDEAEHEADATAGADEKRPAPALIQPQPSLQPAPSGRRLTSQGSSQSLKATMRRSHSVLGSVVSAAAVTPAQRRAARDESGLYVECLKSMLTGMRKDRSSGDAQTGRRYQHTLKLQGTFPKGVRLSAETKARILAQRPHMAAQAVAGGAVGAVVLVHAAAPPTADHLKVAALEMEYWKHVTVRASAQSRSLDASEGVGTCMAVHPSGCFLAIATGQGQVHIYDARDSALRCIYSLRSLPAQAQAPPPASDGGALQRKAARQPPATAAASPRAVAIDGLAFSRTSSLSALYASGAVAILLMRPDDSSSDDINQPLVPRLALHLQPPEMMSSGKLSINEPVGGEQPLLLSTQLAVASPVAFHSAITITGAQPYVMIPQVTGDVLRVTSPYTGPLVLGGARPLGASFVGEGASISATAVNYLLPAPAPSAAAASTAQRLYRHHDGRIVSIAFMQHTGVMLTIDMGGRIALWPSTDDKCSGLGWFTPTRLYQLALRVPTLEAHGLPRPVFPLDARKAFLDRHAAVNARTPAAAGSTAPLAAAPRRGGGGKAGPAVGVPNAADGAAPPEGDADQHDPNALDSEDDELDDDEEGAFLLTHRSSWLVFYAREGAALVRKVIHKPEAAAHNHRNPAGAQSGRDVVIDTYAAADGGQLLKREKQHALRKAVQAHVVAASLTANKEDLLTCLLVPGLRGDHHSFNIFRFQLVSLASWSIALPAIDVYDHSHGTAGPVYAVSSQVTSIGSDYLFVGVGCNVVGVYSLTSGRLMRELVLDVVGPAATELRVISLAFFTVSQDGGGSWPTDVPADQRGDLNAWKSFLAVAVAHPSTFVKLFQLVDDVAIAELTKRRSVIKSLAAGRAQKAIARPDSASSEDDATSADASDTPSDSDSAES